MQNLFSNWGYRWFGFYGNTPELLKKLPTLEQISDKKWVCPDKTQIVSYLESIPIAISCLSDSEYGKCNICAEKIRVNGCVWDGVWSWPIYLGHLVSKHSVRLPEEMLEHIRVRRYACPNNLREPKLHEIPYPKL